MNRAHIRILWTSLMQAHYLLLHPAGKRVKENLSQTQISPVSLSRKWEKVGRSVGRSYCIRRNSITLVFGMATSISLCVFAFLALPPDACGRDLRYVPMNSQTILDMMKDRRAARDSNISKHHLSIRFSSNLKGCVSFPSYTNRKCAHYQSRPSEAREALVA